MSFGLHVNAADCLPQTYLAPVSAASTALALAPPDSVKTSPILEAGSLTPAERSLTSVSQEPGQPLPIGIVRGLKQSSKVSAQASGVIGVGPRSLKLMRVRSTDAAGVRIHFSSLHLADGLKVILYSESSPAQVFGPYTGSGPLGTGDWWGPTIAGETVVVEVQSSTGAEPLDVSGSIDRILHIQAQSEVGVLAVSPCAVDVNCVSGWENEKKGVGYLLFIKGGQGFGCSGSLLNDTDTSDTFPYFLTAYHCVSTEAEANSLEVFWGYETSSCNGVAPSLVNWPQAKRTSVFHFINGRSWQEPDNSNDFSLLRANDVDDIKADVTYNGWTTTNPGVGASVANISHPDQSWKRIALGTYDGSDPNLTQVTWAQGIVQGGSSGSPLFNSSHEIIGQLVGKNSECVNGVPTGADIFGRFSVTHQFVRDYIDPTIRNPAVSIQSFTVSPARVLAGNPVDIVLSAKDTGAAGVGGGLSLSIPGIVQHSDASVSVVQQFNAAQVYWPGFTIHDRKYNIRTVNYLAVNDASTTWAANETKLLKISLTPAISQVLSVQGRAFVNRTSSPYSSRVLAPDLASGSPVDQQLFPVLRQPLTVIADDGYEPDDSRGAAVQIGAGSYTSMAVGQTDEDWYKITILNGCTLNASVVFVNSLGDIDISVYRGSDVSPIAISATTSNTESVQSQNAGADSLYYIRVILKSGGANTYNLTLNVACNVSSPTFSPPTGSYAMDQSVTISCATAGAVIYYTTNGSNPTTSSSSILSGSEIFVTGSATLKAFAAKTSYISSAIVTAVYTINPLLGRAKGDFDRDGNSDILLQHTTAGVLRVWFMNGTTLRSSGVLNPSRQTDLNEQIVGMADINRDSYQDVIFQNRITSQLSVWYMQGLTRIGGALISPSPGDVRWKYVGSGDFNGDTRPDFVLQYQPTGRVLVWYMGGANRIAAGNIVLSLPDRNANVVGVADFNSDTKPDILWQHAVTGGVWVWLMNDIARIRYTWLAERISDANQRIAGVGDFNFDGKPDILWRYKSNGMLSFWLMNGTTRMAGVLSTPILYPDPLYRIAAPR